METLQQSKRDSTHPNAILFATFHATEMQIILSAVSALESRPYYKSDSTHWPPIYTWKPQLQYIVYTRHTLSNTSYISLRILGDCNKFLHVYITEILCIGDSIQLFYCINSIGAWHPVRHADCFIVYRLILIYTRWSSRHNGLGCHVRTYDQQWPFKGIVLTRGDIVKICLVTAPLENRVSYRHRALDIRK